MSSPAILDKSIHHTGYGLMGLSPRPQSQPLENSIASLKKALELGANFWNAGEFYWSPEYNSCHILNAYFTKYPEDALKVILSIKGGLNLKTYFPDGSEAGVRTSIDNCLRLLAGKKSIDLFECARQNRGISLSEVSTTTIRRAAKVAKISAVEVELSLWSTDPLINGIAEACAEHNPIIAYSPLGHGLLTGEVMMREDLPEGDFRRHKPRLQPGVFEENIKLVKELQGLATKKGVTLAQLALAWVRSLSGQNGLPIIIPIPGATTEKESRRICRLCSYLKGSRR
ncbi:hypothetical protein ACEPPN_003323 [Leptodophora sp. 'Broadleaf-Isolate-01']